MTYLKATLSVTVLLFVCLFVLPFLARATDNPEVQIVKLDPEVESTLGTDDMLYALVHYQSDTPLRFQVIAQHEGLVLEVGAIRNPAVLHAPGEGEAMVWVGYTNPTHIDAVRVTVLDEEWRELFKVTKSVDVTWQGVAADQPRIPADWVSALTKSERRKIDFVYDPSPQKNETLRDILFLLSLVSFPAYILLQLRMLWRYDYRWRELAFMPLFPYMILAFYAITGLDIDRSLQVTFLFRYTPMALLYLVVLWCAKRFWQKKLPPPKLYKPPKAKS